MVCSLLNELDLPDICTFNIDVDRRRTRRRARPIPNSPTTGQVGNLPACDPRVRAHLSTFSHLLEHGCSIMDASGVCVLRSPADPGAHRAPLSPSQFAPGSLLSRWLSVAFARTKSDGLNSRAETSQPLASGASSNSSNSSRLLKRQDTSAPASFRYSVPCCSPYCVAAARADASSRARKSTILSSQSGSVSRAPSTWLLKTKRPANQRPRPCNNTLVTPSFPG